MMRKQTKVLTGLLAGAALGGLAAWLISSAKGDNLKEKVSDCICDLLNSSKDKFAKTLSNNKNETKKTQV